MSQNFETCNSTLSNMRAYGQKCYNSFDYFIYFSLSFQHISLSVCNTALSALWSPSLRCSLFLSHFHFFFYLSLFAFWYYRCRFDPSLCLFLSLSLSLSLSFILFYFFSVTISLSFFSYHEEEGDSDLKQSLSIEACQSEPLLTNLKLCSPRAVADLCSSSSIALAIDGWLSLVIDWSVGLGFCWRFWVFLLLFILLRFLDLEFFGGSSDCGCSLWWWL